MTSCLLNPKDNDLLMRMFRKKARLQQEALTDPSKVEAHLRQRNLIIEFVLKRLGPALKARVKTWTTRKYCEEADASSLVYEHVVISVDKYKPEKGNCTFTSFLWTVSNRAFANFISASKRQKRDPQSANQALVEDDPLISIDVEIPNMSSIKERFLVSLDESAPQQTDNSINSQTLADTVPDPGHIDDDLNFNMLMEVISKKCTEQQQQIISLLQENYTYKEIAQEIGATPGTVSRQIQQLRKKLKYEFRHIRSS